MATSATQPQAASAPPAVASPPPRRARVGVSDLAIGMWVADLDRPWLDTPFLLQGFLIEDQDELAALRTHCRHVFVDPSQSTPQALEQLREAEARARAAAEAAAHRPAHVQPGAHTKSRAESARDSTGSARVLMPRSDVRISERTRERFRELVRSGSLTPVSAPLVARALGWLRPGKAAAAAEPSASPPAATRWFPPGVAATVYTDTQSMEQSLEASRRAFGEASDALRDTLAAVRASQPIQPWRLHAAVTSMVDAMSANPDALLWISRVRDDSVIAQPQGVKAAAYMIALGRHMGLPPAYLAHAGTIGLLADLGKARLPRALLDKPGMLSPSEFSIVKDHVQLTLDVLAAAGVSPEVWQGIAQHHERLDGSGYPQGLRSGAISVWGRMAAIVDSFTALITARPYANALAAQDALMSLYEWAETSFDAELVEQFVHAVGIFPVGSLVELSSGEVAVVASRVPARRLDPRVLVLTRPDKVPLPVPCERNLAHGARETRSVRIVRGLAAGSYGLKLRDFHQAGPIEREAHPDR